MSDDVKSETFEYGVRCADGEVRHRYFTSAEVVAHHARSLDQNGFVCGPHEAVQHRRIVTDWAPITADPVGEQE